MRSGDGFSSDQVVLVQSDYPKTEGGRTQDLQPHGLRARVYARTGEGERVRPGGGLSEARQAELRKGDLSRQDGR